MNESSQQAAGAGAKDRLLILTLLTMIAFAANSILCRQALEIDPASCTLIRLVSGAASLWLIVRLRAGGSALAGSFGMFAWDLRGAVLAVLSGAVASGLGYAIWYTVLPSLRATHAATVRLSVPLSLRSAVC